MKSVVCILVVLGLSLSVAGEVYPEFKDKTFSIYMERKVYPAMRPGEALPTMRMYVVCKKEGDTIYEGIQSEYYGGENPSQKLGIMRYRQIVKYSQDEEANVSEATYQHVGFAADGSENYNQCDYSKTAQYDEVARHHVEPCMLHSGIDSGATKTVDPEDADIDMYQSPYTYTKEDDTDGSGTLTYRYNRVSEVWVSTTFEDPDEKATYSWTGYQSPPQDQLLTLIDFEEPLCDRPLPDGVFIGAAGVAVGAGAGAVGMYGTNKKKSRKGKKDVEDEDAGAAPLKAKKKKKKKRSGSKGSRASSTGSVGSRGEEDA